MGRRKQREINLDYVPPPRGRPKAFEDEEVVQADFRISMSQWREFHAFSKKKGLSLSEALARAMQDPKALREDSIKRIRYRVPRKVLVEFRDLAKKLGVSTSVAVTIAMEEYKKKERGEK